MNPSSSPTRQFAGAHTPASVLENSENEDETNNDKTLGDIITLTFRSDSKAIKDFIVTNEIVKTGKLRTYLIKKKQQ